MRGTAGRLMVRSWLLKTRPSKCAFTEMNKCRQRFPCTHSLLFPLAHARCGSEAAILRPPKKKKKKKKVCEQGAAVNRVRA
jgi:hypothetical protein